MADWFTESFRAEFDRQAALIGRFNLAIFGKTGVGKSTLVNAIFGHQVAATGIGLPVTQGSHLYVDQRGTLGLIDTAGLEIGRDDKALLTDLTKVVTQRRKEPIHEQVHAVWYCVRGMDRRFEQSEGRFVQAVHDLGLPVFVVLTQVPRNPAGVLHPDAVALAHSIDALGLPIVSRHPFFTNALRDQFTGQPVHGLMELLAATFQAVPEAVHGALAAAQQIDLAAKAREAQRHIGASVAAAAAAAVTPIPFSDAALLVPIQLAMMARIAQLYTIRFERAAMLAVASSVAATGVGRSAATNLVRLVPGAGTLAGGAVSASVASGVTFAMGQAWLTVVQRAAGGGLPSMEGVIDSRAVQDLFEAEFRRRMPTIRHERPERR